MNEVMTVSESEGEGAAEGSSANDSSASSSDEAAPSGAHLRQQVEVPQHEACVCIVCGCTSDQD